MSKSKKPWMAIWSMLGNSKIRLEREHRLVRRAGVKPGDETYDLFVAIAALPTALKRFIAVFVVLACAVLAGAIVIAHAVATPKGIWVVPTIDGRLVIIDIPKGFEQSPCIDHRHVCLQIAR